ncbi:MAG: hypothetical protein ACYTDW_05315, partial [Planctomycetota bacterium]
HFRDQLWLPGKEWTRAPWDVWEKQGRNSMGDRALSRAENILATHKTEPVDEALAREIDNIVESAKKQL